MKKVSYIILFFAIASCHLFDKKTDENIVARVKESYLYKEDIKSLVDDNMSSSDSALVVNNYIKNWATQQLLISKARLNLSEEKQEEYNSLVQRYETDLLANAYKEAIIKTRIDTIISEAEYEKVYELNNESFKLNEDLLKLRYIQLDKTNQDLRKITNAFKRFKVEDKKHLDSISIQFVSYSLNDSIWVKKSQVYTRIPQLKNKEKEELLKKSNFLQLEDSLRVYLVQITNELKRNQTAPLEYVESTIRQIILNKRKLDLIKKLEVDITQDAIKNKEFEIYE